MNEEPQTEATGSDDFPQMQLSDEMQYLLYEAGKWARVVAVAGFVFCGLMVLLALAMFTGFDAMVKVNPQLKTVPGGPRALAASFLMVSALGLVLSLSLFQFARYAQDGVTYNSEAKVTQALSKVRSMLRFIAILVLLYVGLYLVGSLGALGGA